MKTPLPQGDPYGPETPGYAHLNEQHRQAQSGKKPPTKSRKQSGKSQPDASKPKTP